jgi:hypothetical protein
LQLYTGVNWSPALGSAPFRLRYYRIADLLSRYSLYAGSPVTLASHLITPRPEFTDRGKTTIAVSGAIERAFYEVMQYVTANWARSSDAQERAEARENRAALLRQQAAIAKPKRPKNEIVGTGLLHQELAEAAEVSGYSINELTVLSPKNDPYRFDTRIGHGNAKWFQAQVDKLLGSTATIHLRGLVLSDYRAGQCAASRR